MLLHLDRAESILRRRVGGLIASAALHALAFAVAAGPPDSATGAVAAAADGTHVVAVMAQRPSTTPAAAEEPASETGMEPRPALEVDGIRVELDKLKRRFDALFPFLTLDVHGLVAGAAPATRARRSLVNPFASARSSSSKPPLRLNDAARQRLIDGAWSRRQRWGPFAPVAALVEAHHPDRGVAADLLKTYTDQNLLQPYYDSDTRDARYWTMLGLAADHATFIALVQRVAREHGPSRVTTELLFLLEELAQGSRDTLLMVVGTRPETELRRTAVVHPDAYELAVSVLDRYAGWLHEHGWKSTDAIRAAYDEVRLRLLTEIVETSPGGYRTAEARYLAGVIRFEQNDVDAAERWWRGIASAGECSSEPCRDVLAALELPPGRRAAAVGAALGRAHREWLEFSEQRMRQFGYAVDRY